MKNSAVAIEKRPITLSWNQELLSKKIIFIVPLIAIFGFALIFFIFPYGYYLKLTKEDGVVESGTFIFYFASFIVAFSLANRFFKSKNKSYAILSLILCMGLFYIAMEEISWGQRIFGIKTPDIFMTANYKKEMNTHNVKWFPLHELYMVVGFYAAFFRFFLTKGIKDRYPVIVNLIAPDSYLFFYFFPAFAVYFYYVFIRPFETSLFGDHFLRARFAHMRDPFQEPAELLLSMGFLLFVLINKYRQKTGKMSESSGNAGAR